MNSKSTSIWFLIAAVLFGFVYFWHRHVSAPPPDTHVLAGLQPSAVTGVQIIPVGAPEIAAERTSTNWLLTQPVAYPAQTAAIESLLDSLQKLTFATRFSAGELRAHPGASAEYGFDNPQFSLVVTAGNQRWQLRVGNKTAPGDQVYLRVVGEPGAYVADAAWLQTIPRTADDWRDTALVDAGTDFDGFVLTNNARGIVIELRRDSTNHLWRMLRPLQARADGDRIAEALQKLYAARLTHFTAENPQADLTAFGLQPADLDVYLYHGTNAVGFHVGKSSTNDPASIFVRRDHWNAVATTAKDALSLWRGPVNDFRDPHLLELTAPVAEIDVTSTNPLQSFTLQCHGSNDWSLVGEKYPADPDTVQSFIKLLAGLRVAGVAEGFPKDAGFVQDVVTAPDWKTYGLAAPVRQITLRSAVGTNAVIAQLMFGATQTNEIFVRRADEDFIYAISLPDYAQIPEYGWQFRDRRIWNFTPANVAGIVLHQNGMTRHLLHDGPNQWSLAPGSQGIINPPALEETVHRLGGLTTIGWIARDISLADLAQIGWNTNNLQLTVELKGGAKDTVDFVREYPEAHTALATTVLDGERWAFVFPPVVYQYVLSYLTIPANVP